MKNITILPADTYVVINKTTINEEDKKLVSMLYQPIIGFSAVSLYSTLIDDLDKLQIMSEDLTHHHLMGTMQLKLEEIEKSRKKLEAIGLMKTFVKTGDINNYVYELYSPITAKEFFNHPILGVVLYNNVGKKEYEKLLNYYKLPRFNLKDYDDITSSFDNVFSTYPSSGIEVIEDIKGREKNKLLISKNLDFNMIISSIPKSMLGKNCFSKEVKNTINALSFTYNIDTLDMLGLVRDSINEKGNIDIKNLRKSCRNYYQFETGGKLPTLIYTKQPDFLKKPVGDASKWAKMVYTFENVSPYDYLKSKYKGAQPTPRDLRLVESLLVDQKLNPGVVNVLISYVLKINNQKLSRNYIETIVGQWKRLNVETVEEAMKITEKEHKKTRKIIDKNKTTKKYVPKNKQEEVPDWFNKELNNVDTTKEELEEMDKILKELA